MAPDKQWMNLVSDRLNVPINMEYRNGVKEFLDYAFSKNNGGEEIRCPCIKCFNGRQGTRAEVRKHLLIYGITANYTFWCHHGEKLGESLGSWNEDVGSENSNNMFDMLRDLYPNVDPDDNGAAMDMEDTYVERPNDEAETFYRLLNDSEQPLYDGCKSSKLSTLVKLLHIKAQGKWSNESFNMLLKMMKEELLPEGAALPDSYYEAKKLIKDLGLSYVKIDACQNSCMLFRKDDANLDACKVCKASRWKIDQHSGEVVFKANGKRIPKKVLRYFPLKPRLQRLFMSSKTASLMTWHHDNKTIDGVLRHPADSLAWKSFDENYKFFASEPRNVRLALASDGFQPFTNSKTPYSIWPVVLIPYNLPPWVIMKPSNFILSMLIPGPDSPGDAIDVFLQPFIEDLKSLWEEGVNTFDASKRQNFQMHASLLWTINDFPAYANLSGWSTKGKMACPVCTKDTVHKWLSNGGKHCYMGHRRWLPIRHRWRNEEDLFDGTKEKRGRPRQFSGDEILEQVQDLEGISLTKCPETKVKVSHENRGDNWNKRSIFFDLPYWKTHMLRHNLDVMHIEKNICDSVLGTIMSLPGKTKDTMKTRLDLEVLKLKPDLHPIRDGGKVTLPDATYTLTRNSKRKLCHFLKQLKVPDGFSSNIAHCVNVNELKISGLKSHDCHVLLQHLIPLAIRGLLPKDVCDALTKLSQFFKLLCAKTLKLDELDHIRIQIPYTLCKLEKIFPPSFFDIMVHLPIHLADEAMVGGPVQFRWMYPVERYLHELKSYIRNRTYPEGSIAEGYIASECMTLCSRYLNDIQTKFNKLDRNDDDNDMEDFLGFSLAGRPVGGGKVRSLSSEELEQAHIYVMKNTQDVQPYLEEFAGRPWTNYSQTSQNEITNFIKWFRGKVARLPKDDKNKELEDLLSLSRGPFVGVKCYTGYVINGFRFHTEDHDKHLKTQSSGVVIVGENGVDVEAVDYYGVLREIVELQFLGGRTLALFRCDWCDVYDKVKGVKMDEYGFVSVNLKRTLKMNEPFILASQASQVCFVDDNLNKGWHVAMKVQSRDTYALIAKDNDDEENRELQDGNQP